MPTSSPRIAFIGGGNMARSLIGGLVAQGTSAASIAVAEPNAAARDALVADYGIAAFADNTDAARNADIIVLAVKPQVMRSVCEPLATLAAGTLFVSIAAGIGCAQLDAWLGGGRAIVRCMPNTPALVGAGATGMYANPAVSPAQSDAARTLLQGAGITVRIADEALMDAVTAVSGSGPAYFFLLTEALQAAGEAQGLPPDAARALAVQTCLGAGRMLAESGESAATLRQRVTSPNGTTQAALDSFEADGLRDIVRRAVEAATRRGGELARQSAQ
ncbi:pyrroline-5-carboxylate reductase [Chiayiivirga flava]|uniref:Pyrroline-5-carboxylate reductase n=1 Tax=Chiayiivirga flava TaxID=659595 RepID=A0A7W8G023_9GAMM|nr:pyrroline-5-carboxylate reductase [Chiayiivirga flava]MBB5207263.1 pyrroline-5-carboxylate reductase [Chiayiivirga flava]